MKFKKFVASALAATMVLGSVTTFLADDVQQGSSTGSADFEGHVEKAVFDVELPTVTSEGAFDFILDPEGLIQETDGANYASGSANFTFDAASLYFKNATGDYDYSDTTDALIVTNYSSTAVTVDLEATVAVPEENADVKLTTDSAYTNDETTSIYLALKDDNNTSAVDGTTLKATLEAEIEACDGYEIVATDGTYVYEIDKEAAAASAATYAFYLTGSCNTAADWSNYKETSQPTINVTWVVKPVSEEGSTKPENTIVNDGEHTLTYSKASGLEISYVLGGTATKVESVLAGSSATACTNDISAKTTINDDTIKFSGLWTSASNGSKRYIKITFDSGESATLTLTLAN